MRRTFSTPEPASGHVRENDPMASPIRILFHEPRIPQNTGNAIRLSAVTGAPLHLAGPLGFDLDDAKLRRAGLDYHDMAHVQVHEDLDAALEALSPARVFAFTAHGSQRHTDIDLENGDVYLFGPEPTGLSDAVLSRPEITAQVRIPMLPGRRSLNLANAASIAVYEAWRRVGFEGA